MIHPGHDKPVFGCLECKRRAQTKDLAYYEERMGYALDALEGEELFSGAATRVWDAWDDYVKAVNEKIAELTGSEFDKLQRY